jgi:hypothetical protein
MKNLILIILFSLLGGATTFGQKKMEFFGQVSQEKVIPTSTINFSANKKFNEKIGMSFFSLVSSSGWAEAYFGPTFSGENLRFSLSAGIETGGNNFRVGMSTFIVFRPEMSFLLIAEKGDGRDNYWYHCQLMKSWEKISTGMMIRRFSGVGPRIEVKVYENFSLWAAPLYDLDQKKIKGIVSLVVNFK